jgi:hypothetical protein
VAAADLEQTIRRSRVDDLDRPPLAIRGLGH